MKISLSKQSPDRGGDIVSLARLLSVLEDHKKTSHPKELGQQIVLDLWIEYLGEIENRLLAANMGRVAEKSTFNLPFERDFVKKLEARGGEG